ncbi:gamma-glutamyl-gamma-aminobutyrate hydrolase family protein [Alloiococcus sp. CFN-8]|uniref:gamma-glutamyl-gamma-aminobutyrate hydrolase family protein n=1 Tax=Alloiococcus sp. CFN-8 TaxID=3416081 RepID=UPI003CE8D8AA
MKPIIGVTPLFDDEKNSIWMLPEYLEAVKLAGGLPIILPLECENDDIDKLIGFCDGFLYTGGQDVDPLMYGEIPSEYCCPCNEKRDILEAKLFTEIYSKNKPILGICRGLQFINVMLGGSLYQDIPTELESDVKLKHHQEKPYSSTSHWVSILEDTPLMDIFKSEGLYVNSIHHQGIKELAPKAMPMALSEDGLIEAFYVPSKKFVMGVQWHPEYLFKEDKKQLGVIDAFISSC